MAIGLFDGLEERFKDKPLETILGKGANMPFNNCNSSVRKGMYNIHSDHRIPIKGAEIPFINTPYPNQYGKLNSAIIQADDDYVVIAKISKFKSFPDMNYILVVQSKGKYDILERKMYKRTTEANGYKYDTSYMDKLSIGSQIHKGDIVRKSVGTDEFMNKLDGMNALMVFMNVSKTTEDGIIVCEDIRDKFETTLFHSISCTINDNDIPLNLYGDDTVYRIAPRIGEDIKDNILCAFRLKKEREKFYSLSMERLKHPMISDRKKICKGGGTVVDIDIQCNNTELLYSYYNGQLLDIYTEQMQFSKNIVNALKPLIEQHRDKCTDALKDLYIYHNKVVNGYKYMNNKDKAQSFCVVDFMVMSSNPLNTGDKITSRYGSKGVISAFLPREKMPKFDNGQHADIIVNSASMPGRLNNGNTLELESNFSTARTLEYIRNGLAEGNEIQTYLKIIDLISPKEGEYVRKRLDMMTDSERKEYMETVLQYPCAFISLEPISDSFGIDRLDKIYKECPWIKPYKTEVEILDSNGNPRKVQTRRDLVAGYVYYYRLKQYAEDKFSATSFSPTNITGENSRSKANKMYETPYSKTPINFGNMEIADLGHMDPSVVIEMLLLYSASPQARHLAEELSTGDPFDCDVVVIDECRNRVAEKNEAYLKTMGYRIIFEKKRKVLGNPVMFLPVTFDRKIDAIKSPVKFYNNGELMKPVLYVERRPDGLDMPVIFQPVEFGGGKLYDQPDNE